MKAVLQQPVKSSSFNTALKPKEELRNKNEAFTEQPFLNAAGPSFSFGNISLYPPPVKVQTKLAVNTPGDKYEQEADAMADKVMRMDDRNILKTKKSSSSTLQRKCAECEKGEDEKLHRKETNNSTSFISNAVHQILQAPGKPLDKSTRSFMEQRFGFDFGKVRIHDDSKAHQSAKDISALAYTHGDNIAFGTGQYVPQTEQGKKLLAHELMHVVQQGAATIVRSNNLIFRKVDHWLHSSMDIESFTYSELIAERDEIKEWLHNQTQSSYDSVRLTEVLELLEKKIAEWDKNAKKKKGTKKRNGGRDNKSLPVPRILEERQSIVYSSPEEMRKEYDLISAWLLRSDLSKTDRAILQIELDQLKPSFDKNMAANASAKRRVKIQQAITPQFEDVNERLMEIARRIQGIYPLDDTHTQYVLMLGNSSIVISVAELNNIYAGVIKEMDSLSISIKSIRNDAFEMWGDQAYINQEESLASWGVSVKTNRDAIDVSNQLYPMLDEADYFLSKYRIEKRNLHFVEMASFLLRASRTSAIAKKFVRQWIDQSIEAAEDIQKSLEDIKWACDKINMVLGAATGGTASLVISNVASAATDLAEQASEVHYGLKDHIEWGEIGLNLFLGFLTAKLGGDIGKRLGGVLIPKLGAVGARAVTNILVGRGSAIFNRAVSTLYTKLKNEDRALTVDEFLTILADELSADKAFTDLVLGEVGHHAQSHAGSGGERKPPINQLEVETTSQNQPTVPAKKPPVPIGGKKADTETVPPHTPEVPQPVPSAETPVKETPPVAEIKPDISPAGPPQVKGPAQPFEGLEKMGKRPDPKERGVTREEYKAKRRQERIAAKEFTPEERAASKKLEKEMAVQKEATPISELAKESPELHREVISNKITMADGKTTLRDLAVENPGLIKELYAEWKKGVANGKIKSKDFGRYVRRRQSGFRGHSGELDDAFARGPNEIMVKAPKANVNEPGTDSISYDKATGHIKLLDNKSLRAGAKLGKVSALEENLSQNLGDDITAIEKFVGDPGVPPEIQNDVLPRLKAAKADIDAYVLKNKLTPKQLESTSVQKDFTVILNKHGINRVVTFSGSGQGAGASDTLTKEKGFQTE